MYKFIALDVDGTLMTSKRTITDSTRNAIEAARKKGVIVSISSGRPYVGVGPIAKGLGLNAPMIAYNGGMIVDSSTDQIIYECSMKPDHARKVIADAKEEDTTLIIWSKDKLYVNRIDDRVESYIQISDVVPHLIEDYEALIVQGITKLLWIDELDTIEAFREIYRTKYRERLNVVRSLPMFLEFVDKGVSKAEAMKRIGERHGIRQEEMIAIGDGDNDLEMLEYAGLGIAMGNAHDEVKRAADAVTASNDEDGIAKAIQKYILDAQ